MEFNIFVQVLTKENDRRASAKIRGWLQKDFEDVFSGIGYFDGIFSLQVKPDSKAYQALPRCVAFALQKPL